MVNSYRFAVQLMKSSTFCALAIVYAIYSGLWGGSYTTVQDHACKEVNTDGALQGTGPLKSYIHFTVERTGWCVCSKNIIAYTQRDACTRASLNQLTIPPNQFAIFN